MTDFRFYSPEDVIYENLRDITERMDMLCEQERAHLRELAAEITKDLSDNSEIALSLPDLLPKSFEFHVRALPQNVDMLEQLRPIRATWQTVLLCMEVCKQLHQKTEFGLSSFFPDTDEKTDLLPNRIIYQRSTYADAAYLRFASFFNDVYAVYTHSFPVACEEVYHGLCKYCILPLENTSEGQLSSFARLIDRYELKLAATCSVTATDGSRTTRFALLRRNLLPTFSEKERERYFEFSAPLTEGTSNASILLAAELCGLKLCRTDARPRQSDSGPLIFTRFVFRIGNGNLMAFLLYLFAKVPLGEYIGIYPHLN